MQQLAGILKEAEEVYINPKTGQERNLETEKPFTVEWNDVKNICIVNYKMKEEIEEFGASARIHLGVVAEQVESVSPGLLENSGYSQKWCTCLNGVKTSILYMKAVKALQEAMCRIEVLESCLGMS
jgi:hypothetical protein